MSSDSGIRLDSAIFYFQLFNSTEKFYLLEIFEFGDIDDKMVDGWVLFGEALVNWHLKKTPASW